MLYKSIITLAIMIALGFASITPSTAWAHSFHSFGNRFAVRR